MHVVLSSDCSQKKCLCCDLISNVTFGDLAMGYAVEQRSGTYGSSGDGIWLPDNVELKKKSPPATL